MNAVYKLMLKRALLGLLLLCCQPSANAASVLQRQQNSQAATGTSIGVAITVKQRSFIEVYSTCSYTSTAVATGAVPTDGTNTATPRHRLDEHQGEFLLI